MRLLIYLALMAFLIWKMVDAVPGVELMGLLFLALFVTLGFLYQRARSRTP